MRNSLLTHCNVLYIFFCLWLTDSLSFFLTIQNESSLQVLVPKSIVEMKMEVTLMSFSNIYFWKKIRIWSYFSLILPERFWISSELALKPTIGSHEISCYHHCSLQNLLSLIWPVFLLLVVLCIRNILNHRDGFHHLVEDGSYFILCSLGPPFCLLVTMEVQFSVFHFKEPFLMPGLLSSWNTAQSSLLLLISFHSL